MVAFVAACAACASRWDVRRRSRLAFFGWLPAAWSIRLTAVANFFEIAEGTVSSAHAPVRRAASSLQRAATQAMVVLVEIAVVGVVLVTDSVVVVVTIVTCGSRRKA